MFIFSTLAFERDLLFYMSGVIESMICATDRDVIDNSPPRLFWSGPIRSDTRSHCLHTDQDQETINIKILLHYVIVSCEKLMNFHEI